MGIEFEPGPRIPVRVSLDEAEQALIQSDVARRFAGLWRGLRGDATIPAAGLNPLRFGATVRSISLIEVEAPDRAVFRIAARDLEEAMGHALRGLNAIDLLVDESFRPVRVWRFAQVVGTPCGFYMRTEPPTSRGLIVPREVVGLPIAPRPGGGSQVLICVAAIGRPVGVASAAPSFRWHPSDFAFIDVGAGTPAADRPP